jgi:hypothetical protein
LRLTTRKISTTSLRATVARFLRRLAKSNMRSTQHWRPSSNNRRRTRSMPFRKPRHQHHQRLLEVLGSTTLRHHSQPQQAADMPPLNRSPCRLRRTGNLNTLHPLADMVPRNLQASLTIRRRTSRDSPVHTTHRQHRCEMVPRTLLIRFTPPSG